MRDPNNRIHMLAERALTLSNNDIVRAVRILSEMTGLSFELAFEAIEDVVGEVKVSTHRNSRRSRGGIAPPGVTGNQSRGESRSE